MKREEKEKARQLRQQGESLGAIALQLGVAKSSVSLWVNDLTLSKHAREKIAQAYTNGQRAAQAAIKARTAKRLGDARTEAERAIVAVTFSRPEEALAVCALIYWCEGRKGKNDGDLVFSNSDPLLVRTYLSLLRRAVPELDESRFRVRMHLHEYHQEAAQLKFWSNVTRISRRHFSTTYWKPHTGKNHTEGYQGCIHIRYSDVRVARKIYAAARAILQRESV